MADDSSNISKEALQIEDQRRLLLRDQLLNQQGIVESLKEALGIKTRLTEFEGEQLKTSREIAKALSNQNTSLTSLADKNKQIEKNKALIARTSLSQSILESKNVKIAIQQSSLLKEQLKRLQEEQSRKAESGELNEKAIQDQQAIVQATEDQYNLGLQALTLQEQAEYFQHEAIQNLTEATAQRERERDTILEIGTAMGLSGQIAKGLSKIPGFKGLEGSVGIVEEKLRQIADAGEELPSSYKTFSMIVKQTGKDLAKKLLDPLVSAAFVTTQIASIFKRMDTLTSGTARNFGISNEQAGELNKELTETATTQEGLFGSTTNLNEAFQVLNNRYGTFAKFGEENLKTFVRLTKEAGISGDVVESLQDTTYLTGKTLKEQTIEYKGQVKILKATTGLALNEKQILESIKDVSTATKIQLGGSAEAIATAVFKAKALGVEMKDLENISSSLLNFQSSIEDELAAELLTGKQLNLEGARYAALIGDQGMLAEELASNFGTVADFQRMNVIEQGALAQAVGLTRDSLAESLMKREAMLALSQFEGNTEKEKYATAVQQLGVDGARLQLGNDALATQMESVSLQDKMAAAGVKLQEALVPLASGVLPVISTIFKFIGDNINGIVTALKLVIPLMVAYKAASIAAAVANIAGAAALSAGAAGIIATVAGVAALAFLTTIGDGIFPAEGKTTISPKEGGLFQVSPNDDIIVAPGIAKTVRSNSNNNNSNNSQQIENKVNITPSNTNITLTLDGQSIGNANARQSYRVGSNVKAFGGNVDMSAYT